MPTRCGVTNTIRRHNGAESGGRPGGEATIGEPHHTDRLLQIDIKAGLLGITAQVGVELDGSPCSATSTTCRDTGTHQVGGLLSGVLSTAGTLLGGLLGLTPQPPFATMSSATPLGFTSQVADPSHELTQYQARTYNPADAAWLQCDTDPGHLDQPLTQNRYAYVNDNPTTFIDPTGHSAYLPANDGASVGGNDGGYNCLATTGGGDGQCNAYEAPAAPDPYGSVSSASGYSSDAQYSASTTSTDPSEPHQDSQQAGYGGSFCIPQIVKGQGLPSGSWENIPNGPPSGVGQTCQGSYVVANGDNGILDAVTAFGALFGIVGIGAPALTSIGESTLEGGTTWVDGAELERTVNAGGTSVSILGEVSRSGATVTVDNIALYGTDGAAINQVGPQAIRAAGGALLREASGSGVKQVIFRGVRALNSSGKAGHIVNWIATLGDDGSVTWTLGR